jgi:Transposase
MRSRARRCDHADALVFANILRTDLAAHRPLPADSELVGAIAVLARAPQDAVWDRTRAHNKLRSLLREQLPRIPGSVGDLRGGSCGQRPAPYWQPPRRRRRRPG